MGWTDRCPIRDWDPETRIDHAWMVVEALHGWGWSVDIFGYADDTEAAMAVLEEKR